MQSGDETEKSTAVGAATGGLLGILLGAPLLAIPGIGPALVAGPLAAGLTGAAVGGFLGSMQGWGVHEDHIKQYQRAVDEGKLLVVATGNPQQVAEAKGVLQGTKALTVNTHADNSADAGDIVRGLP